MKGLFVAAMFLTGFIALAGTIEGLEQAFGLSPWFAVPIAIFVLPSGILPIGFAIYGMIEGWHWHWYWAVLCLFWPMLMFGIVLLVATIIDALRPRRPSVAIYGRSDASPPPPPLASPDDTEQSEEQRRREFWANRGG